MPRYVVTIHAGRAQAARIIGTAGTILAERERDLVVEIDLRAGGGDPRPAQLRSALDGDPRVRIAPAGVALDEFPAAEFHVTLPATVVFPSGLVHRLRAGLGDAVTASALLPDNTAVLITRTWALHRARRSGSGVARFGAVRRIPASTLMLRSVDRAGVAHRMASAEAAGHPAAWPRLVDWARDVRGAGEAWSFLRWSIGLARWWAANKLPRAVLSLRRRQRSHAVRAISLLARATPDTSPRAGPPGPRDPGGHAAGPVRPGSLTAFDPRICNPIGWLRAVGNEVAALGPRELLPPGVEAHRVVHRDDLLRLRRMHHVEDVQAFHAGPAARAAALARLAAAGVLVHLADGDRNTSAARPAAASRNAAHREDGGRDPATAEAQGDTGAGSRLEALLGAGLHRLMTTDVRDLDPGARELLSIGMRRAALRDHAWRARGRRPGREGSGAFPSEPRSGARHWSWRPDPGRDDPGTFLSEPPPVSILLATRRPRFLPWILAAVARQTYPNLELVLALHGGPFAGVERRVAELHIPVRVVEVSASEALGAVLDAATAAANGALLTKMDDDDLYGADHVWDLVLAHEYSRAPLVGKHAEFVYLSATDQTIHRVNRRNEDYQGNLTGGALLISRRALDRVGGWRKVRRSVDSALIADLVRTGRRIYRTHGAGYLMVRHGDRHTWDAPDHQLLAEADRVSPGWNPEMAGIEPPAVRHPALDGGGRSRPPAWSVHR